MKTNYLFLLKIIENGWAYFSYQFRKEMSEMEMEKDMISI